MDKAAETSDSMLADDLLEGAAEIAEHTGFGLRRTFYLLEKGDLPAGKLRGRYISSKSRLRRYFDELLAGSD